MPTSSSRSILELRRHGVEGRAEHGEIAVGRIDVDLDAEIAFGDLLRGPHQLADRGDETIGEPHADPDRREQQGERYRDIHEPEGHLHAGATLLEQLIFGDIGARRAQLLQHARVHRPDHIEIGIVEIIKTLDRADEARLARRDHDHLSFLGKVHRLLRRRAIGKFRHRGRGGEHPAVAVDEIGHGQSPDRGLGAQERAETLRLRAHQIDRLVDVLGHAERVGADDLTVLLKIGRSHVDRVLDDRLGADREPMIEAAVKRHAGEDREQDGGDDGDHAEQTDDTGMELGAGNLPPSREPKSADLPGDDSQHGEHEHEIDEQNAHDHEMRWHDGGETGQDGVGGEPRAQREHHGDQAEREGQTARADGIARGSDGRHG